MTVPSRLTRTQREGCPLPRRRGARCLDGELQLRLGLLRTVGPAPELRRRVLEALRL